MTQIEKATGIAARMTRFMAVAVISILLAVAARPAQAAPLNLTLQTASSMMADYIDVSYDAASQTLTARGLVEYLVQESELPAQLANGTFTITAVISNTGAISSGTLTIAGELPALGVAQGTLLTGQLKDFGFGEAGGPLEFQFTTDGGALASNYAATTGVILSQSRFPGNFTESFSNAASGMAGIGL